MGEIEVEDRSRYRRRRRADTGQIQGRYRAEEEA